MYIYSLRRARLGESPKAWCPPQVRPETVMFIPSRKHNLSEFWRPNVYYCSGAKINMFVISQGKKHRSWFGFNTIPFYCMLHLSNCVVGVTVPQSRARERAFFFFPSSRYLYHSSSDFPCISPTPLPPLSAYHTMMPYCDNIL